MFHYENAQFLRATASAQALVYILFFLEGACVCFAADVICARRTVSGRRCRVINAHAHNKHGGSRLLWRVVCLLGRHQAGGRPQPAQQVGNASIRRRHLFSTAGAELAVLALPASLHAHRARGGVRASRFITAPMSARLQRCPSVRPSSTA